MAQVLSVTCLLVALCSVQGALAFYSAGSEVVSLTPSNFEKNMKQSVWLVEFYAPWYVHCIQAQVIRILLFSTAIILRSSAICVQVRPLPESQA